MIHVVLSTLVVSLNEYIKNELNLQDDMVVLANPADLGGKVNPQIENKLVVFLQNIEEERVIRNGSYQAYAGINPPNISICTLCLLLIFQIPITLNLYATFPWFWNFFKVLRFSIEVIYHYFLQMLTN